MNKNLVRRALWFVPLCFTAGVINGLLGAGGGVIMLYVIGAYLKGKGEESGKDAFATVIAVILPVSAVSAVTYALRGAIDMDVMQVMFVPAIAGGILGAYLTDRLPTKVIRGIFAVLVIVSGIRLI